MCYQMEEFYYPPDDLIYNKNDELDGVIFVKEGEIHITMRSSISCEFVLDKLFKRSTFGFHSCLKDEEDGPPLVSHRLVSHADTQILKLPIQVLRESIKKSKNLKNITSIMAKNKPICDFTTFLTFQRTLSFRQLRSKFKRAVRR